MEKLFEKEAVSKVYFKLALPVVLSMIVSMVYSLADTYFVAKTGNANLVAGVTIGAPLFSFMLAVGDIFGLGGSAIVSQLFGQKNYNLSKHLASASFYATIVISLVLTVILLIFEKPILLLLGAKPATYQYAADFYRVLVAGSTFITVSLVPGNLIRTEGLAVQSMVATMAGTILAIILDPLFLFVFNWGAAGVALANVLGYALNTSLLIYCVKTKSRYLSFSLKLAKLSWADWKWVIEIGIPASITNFMQTFGMALLNNYLAPFGAASVAAMGITQKIYGIVILVLVGFAFGAQPLVGYCYGAKNVQRFKEVLRFDIMVEVVYALVFSVILMILAPGLVSCFMNQAEIVKVGAYMLRACLATTPFIGLIMVLTTVFQSASKAMSALLMSVSRQGVFYLLVMLAFSSLFGYHGIIWAQAVADILTAIMGIYLYRRSFKDFN